MASNAERLTLGRAGEFNFLEVGLTVEYSDSAISGDSQELPRFALVSRLMVLHAENVTSVASDQRDFLENASV